MDSFFLYEVPGEFSGACAGVCRRQGFERSGLASGALFAVAPLLTRKLCREEWAAPRLGTLIFHPSLLPFRRGPDAVRWAVGQVDASSGVTWFWADEGLDAGPICEQEPVRLVPGESPGRAYHTRYIPAGLRALERAVAGIRAGLIRRVPQAASEASYQSFWTQKDGITPSTGLGENR